MRIGATEIDDAFAEAFGMRYTRLIVTAHDAEWLEHAIAAATGYACSVIGCDAEVGLEQRLDPTETPDGRVGAAIMAFGFSADALGKAVSNRVGQCVMTCPSTAVYDGLPEAATRLPLGKHLRFFGDGFQKSKVVAGRRYWRVPVMDGEFVVEESLGVERGVAGGNLLVQATSEAEGLAAARRGVQAVARLPQVITPFPGGVARSGSKVGSRYPKLKASTADAFCPTLRSRTPTKVHPEAHYVYEIVIDGASELAVARAMGTALAAAAGPHVPAISAGNYGGKLGKFHFPLRQIVEQHLPAEALA